MPLLKPPEEWHQIALVKKRIVDTIQAEARIDENRNISVKFRMDLLKLAENNLEPASKGKPRKLKKNFHASQIVAVALCLFSFT